MTARLKVGCLLFSIITCSAPAAPDGPPQDYLIHEKDVLLTKVESVSGDSVVFSTTEVLKGKTHSPLILKPTSGMVKIFKPGEEYILCWMGEISEKGIVCSSMFFGTPEWFCIPASREGGKVMVSGVGSLEKVKEICAGLVPAK